MLAGNEDRFCLNLTTSQPYTRLSGNKGERIDVFNVF